MNYYIAYANAIPTLTVPKVDITRGLSRIEDINYFKRLRNGCRVWRLDNLEWDYGKQYKLYSPYSNTLVDKEIHEFTNFEILEGYIKDGNIWHSN